jgi:hypothetical protein
MGNVILIPSCGNHHPIRMILEILTLKVLLNEYMSTNVELMNFVHIKDHNNMKFHLVD